LSDIGLKGVRRHLELLREDDVLSSSSHVHLSTIGFEMLKLQFINIAIGVFHRFSLSPGGEAGWTGVGRFIVRHLVIEELVVQVVETSVLAKS
jgi:hypothetical protein